MAKTAAKAKEPEIKRLAASVGSKCQEASPLSHNFYIACGKPAVFVVKNTDPRPYCMCVGCADHNVRNRNAEYVMDTPAGRKMKIAEDQKPSPTGRAPFQPNMQTITPKTKEVAKIREALTKEDPAPSATLLPLKGLDLIHARGKPVEDALIGLNDAVIDVLREAKKHGDRAAHLVQIYAKMRTAQDILSVQLKTFSDNLGLLADRLIPDAFEREALQTLTTRDGDRATITQKLYASVLAAKREEAYKWLRANGHEALVQETINSSSLTVFAKAELAEGRELPDDIFSIFTKPALSFTKAKK